MKRPGHGTLVAYTALLVALSGSAYAASRLPAHSVGTAQLRARAVGTAQLVPLHNTDVVLNSFGVVQSGVFSSTGFATFFARDANGKIVSGKLGLDSEPTGCILDGYATQLN